MYCIIIYSICPWPVLFVCVCAHYMYSMLSVGGVYLSVKARVARSGLQMDKRSSYLIHAIEGHSWWKTGLRERKKGQRKKEEETFTLKLQ